MTIVPPATWERRSGASKEKSKRNKAAINKRCAGSRRNRRSWTQPRKPKFKRRTNCDVPASRKCHLCLGRTRSKHTNEIVFNSSSIIDQI
jgi:hypothetical protein